MSSHREFEFDLANSYLGKDLSRAAKVNQISSNDSKLSSVVSNWDDILKSDLKASPPKY